MDEYLDQCVDELEFSHLTELGLDFPFHIVIEEED